MVYESRFRQVCKIIAKFDVAVLQQNKSEARRYAIQLAMLMDQDPEIAKILNISDHLEIAESKMKGLVTNNKELEKRLKPDMDLKDKVLNLAKNVLNANELERLKQLINRGLKENEEEISVPNLSEFSGVL
jgi:hypothetical protein